MTTFKPSIQVPSRTKMSFVKSTPIGLTSTAQALLKASKESTSTSISIRRRNSSRITSCSTKSSGSSCSRDMAGNAFKGSTSGKKTGCTQVSKQAWRLWGSSFWTAVGYSQAKLVPTCSESGGLKYLRQQHWKTLKRELSTPSTLLGMKLLLKSSVCG